MSSIMTATAELLELHGYGNLTVDAIATRAGVSKATIYRWWSEKAEVAMDAVLAAIEPVIVTPNTGSVVADLELQVRSVIEMLTTTSHGSSIAGLIAEVQVNPAIGDSFREKFLKSRREAALVVLRRARDRGEIGASLDLEAVVDCLYGPVYYRLLLHHQPLDEEFGTRVVANLCSGVLNLP